MQTLLVLDLLFLSLSRGIVHRDQRILLGPLLRFHLPPLSIPPKGPSLPLHFLLHVLHSLHPALINRLVEVRLYHEKWDCVAAKDPLVW